MLSTSLLAVALALAGAATAHPGPRPSVDGHERRQAQAQSLTGNTQNGLTQGTGPCKANIIVFARGTTESGNVGTIVGPPVFQAVASRVGAANLAVQGVDYPASVPGFLAGGDATGSKTMATLVSQALAQCPKSNVIMMGYSQGGFLVHKAAQALPAATAAKVAAAVIFGDPANGSPVAGVTAAKTLIVCHDQDNICQHGDLILPAHLTYGNQDADTAANFISKVVSKKGRL